MSGHSKWSTIKHKKAATDERRGKLFSKLAKMIAVAAREKGPDPAMNARLRMAVETAHSANMPKENIERAIKKGVGELEGSKLEEITLEVYGPEGTAMIVECITDNKNRTLSEIKKILSAHNAKLAQEGGVRWMFEQRGVIRAQNASASKESMELAAIDAGAEDIAWNNDILVVYVAQEKINETKQILERQEFSIESASLEWVPKNTVQISEQQREELEKLFEALDEYDDVQEIYSNLE